jgi:hypothetical protein
MKPKNTIEAFGDLVGSVDIGQKEEADSQTGTLVKRLQKVAEIRRSAQPRKSVQEGKPDKISDLLEEAAARIKELEAAVSDVYWGLDDAMEDPYVRGDCTAKDVLGDVMGLTKAYIKALDEEGQGT